MVFLRDFRCYFTYFSYVFLFLCCHCFGGYKYDLAVCAIFRDEAPYLKEWIEFHKLMGASHFYLYNNLSQDNYKEVLKPYIHKGVVELIDWPYESSDQTVWGPIQVSSYVDGLKRATGNAKWVAILDIDEFCFPVNDLNLVDFLKKYRDFGGVVVNWQMYGTSGINKIPFNQLVIESLTIKANKDWGENAHIKSIVRPERVIHDWKTGWTVHSVTYRSPYFAVNSNFEQVAGPFSPILIDKIRINHYWTRDENYFLTRKLQRRGKWLDQKDELIEKITHYNAVEDKSISRFIPALKKQMQK